MFKENKSEDSNNAVSERILATGSKKLKSLRDVFPTGFSADILNHTLSTTSGSFSKCSIPVLLDLGLCNSPKDSSNPFMTISVCHCFHLFHPGRIRIHQSSCKDMVSSIVASPFLLLGLDYVVIRSKSSFSESLLNYN